MTRTLYTVPASAFGSKVRLALRVKGLNFNEKLPPDGYGSPAYKALVPAGTVPALDDDGFVLAESEAIVEYLEEQYPAPHLLPDDVQQRARLRELSRFHDTRLEPYCRALYPHAAPESRDDGFVAWQGMMINDRLIQLGDLVSRSAGPFLGGEVLSIADMAYPASFRVIDVLSDLFGFSVAWPEALGDYRMALQRHPVVAAELDVYGAGITAWADSKRESA